MTTLHSPGTIPISSDLPFSVQSIRVYIIVLTMTLDTKVAGGRGVEVEEGISRINGDGGKRHKGYLIILFFRTTHLKENE